MPGLGEVASLHHLTLPSAALAASNLLPFHHQAASPVHQDHLHHFCMSQRQSKGYFPTRYTAHLPTMKPSVYQDQGGEEDDSATGSARTPPTRDGESTIIDAQWDGLPYAVPWPGSTFIIVEKSSGKAITVRDGKVVMEEHGAGAGTGASSDKGKQWFCVEKNGHFGFQNQASGNYIGHDGTYGIRASASHLLAYEFIVVRKHPQGGY
jgi:hypothetical protein